MAGTADQMLHVPPDSKRRLRNHVTLLGETKSSFARQDVLQIGLSIIAPQSDRHSCVSYSPLQNRIGFTVGKIAN